MTALLLLWLLGAEPQSIDMWSAGEPADIDHRKDGDVPIYDPNSATIMWKRAVGPILTDEECGGFVDKNLRREPNKINIDVWDFEGHKVCMETWHVLCGLGDIRFKDSQNNLSCGRPDKLVSRHCWCAEKESK